MKKLRRSFERFCFKHRKIGIPNLMLFISIGTALVYLMSLATNSYVLYSVLCFDRAKILQGQVWRLFTFIFTYNAGTPLLTAISLICYYSLGRAMENIWGTLRFNLYYFCGIIMMDIYCLIVGSFLNFNFITADVTYLNLSLFLGYATLYPDSRFLLFFIIPVKAWIFAVIDLGLMLYSLVVDPFPLNLFSVIALANYFLFFGRDVVNVFPLAWRSNTSRLFRKKKKTGGPTVIPFPNAGSYEASTASTKAPYTHCCTICRRTDVTNPELEFRYCSRCTGYRCYCEDHINNHTHE